MKEKFREKVGLNPANMEMLELVNSILEEYMADGYTLTLRQLYYQLVSRDIIPNKDSEYKKIGNLLAKGRMAGVVDWSAIEDRLRIPKLPYWVHGIEDALSDTIDQYRLNRQRGQDVYIEVWGEKDALSGIMSRVTKKYHVRLMINRGYSSVSAMYDAFNRMSREIGRDRKVYILYFGDHDPSGLDMIRDIRERLSEFFTNSDDLCDKDPGEIEELFEVVPIGLTMEQIKRLKPPPNPAKITDPRAKWYLQKHGTKSWEVDAIPPQEITEILTDAIESRINLTKYTRILAEEERNKEYLQEVIYNEETRRHDEETDEE